MFGTRDLFSKSEKINEIADRRLEFYTNQLLNLTSAKTLQSASEQDDLKKAYEDFLKNAFQQDSQIFYLRRLYQQAKQLSQIIAYIWRNIEEDGNRGSNAKKLKEYFISPTEETTDNDGNLIIEPGGNLKKLLAANPKESGSEENVEANLLRQVFPDYESNYDLIFPMFSDFELGENPDFSNLGYLFEINVNDFFGVLEDVNVNNPSLFKFVIPYPPRPQLSETTVTTDDLEDWIANREKNEYFADNPYIPTTCS